MISRKLTLACALVCAIVGCSGLVIDRSPDAYASGDYTLISTCSAVPSRGMDVCYATEGDTIASSWRLVIPQQKGIILGADVDVYYRDLHKAYSANTEVVEIPWKDFFGQDTWTASMDGEAEALATIRWKDTTGVEQILLLRGLAKIIVTKKGYDRMPFDSGFSTFGTTCKIQYSTAGRSALDCK